MSQSNFEIDLRDAYQKREQKSFRHRPQRTNDCPTLARFAEALDRGWSPSDRHHVSDCDYCQKIMLFEWRLHPPGLWRLVEYVADISADRRSIQMYLEENPAYARLQKSALVKSLARGIRGIKGLVEPALGFESVADLGKFFGLDPRGAAVYTRGSAAQRDMTEEEAEERALQRVRDYADSITVTSAPHEDCDERHRELSIELLDGSTSLELVMEEGQLMIAATSSVTEKVGRRLIIDVLPHDGAPISVEVLMRRDGASGRSVGAAAAYTANNTNLRELSVIAAWIP